MQSLPPNCALAKLRHQHNKVTEAFGQVLTHRDLELRANHAYLIEYKEYESYKYR